MDYIYRDFSHDLTTKKCTTFLQAIAITKGHITSNFNLAKALPEKTVNLWTMFYRIGWISQENIDRFEELVGKRTTKPERVSGA